MNSEALELASLALFLEAQVADPRFMLEALPRDEFGTEANRETFARLKRTLNQLMLVCCVSLAFSEQANPSPKEDECR